MLASPTPTKPRDVISPSAPRKIAVRRALHTLSTLLLASCVCVGMLVIRVVWAGNFHLSELFENLVLAWIPLSVALLIRYLPALRGWRRLWFWLALVIWVLFYPNAFYLVTDFTHLGDDPSDGVAKWFDLLMITSFASGGMFLGCLSLYLMQLFVQQRFSGRIGWSFAITMLALGSFGIYMGRVLRLNSWTIISHPFRLFGRISGLTQAATLWEAVAFSATFFFFSLAIYTFLISIARLHEKDAG
jgi:uncharacterized membrane protein